MKNTKRRCLKWTRKWRWCKTDLTGKMLTKRKWLQRCYLKFHQHRFSLQLKSATALKYLKMTSVLIFLLSRDLKKNWKKEFPQFHVEAGEHLPLAFLTPSKTSLTLKN